ncbi:response regulator transcription factor [Paenibacillus sp. sptzw28]|uniref:response regulator transcription factor n=1 Tax=Paenibacillus sp. sptzw28 TaxID=715179 RepID=UPI001C6F18E1|nr:response regulator transcription factor [Paenibacillus sp. sptzw28]QYR21166.1 response regulator transcription factor [Paenibacillus sp. sptzw28]
MYKTFLVDDEPFILDGLFDAVDWSLHELEITGRAENGRQALELLREVPADILITDITMPLMNGLELIRAAREFKPGLKVIILSGYNEFDYLKEAMTLGIENYLLKPVNFKELNDTLANTIMKLNGSGLYGGYTEDEIDILRDNILYRWITGRIAPDELAGRVRLLDIRLEGSYMLAAIICLDTDGGSGLLKPEIKQRITRRDNAVCFSDIEGRNVVVFMADCPLECKREALDFLASLRKETPFLYRISLGTAERLGEGERLSYERALRAQEYFLMLGRTDTADAETLLPDWRGQQPQLQVDWSDYGRLMMTKDKAGLLGRIEDELRRMQVQEGVTPELLRGLALEIMVYLKIQLKELKRSESYAGNLYKSLFEQAAKAIDIEQLIAAVKKTAGMTVDELVRSDKSPIITQILNHIQMNYPEDMSLKSLGQQYNIHPVYLGQLFHKETNESFTDYINKYRIERAKKLLRETTMKVQDIAKEVGYWETGYFYKQFKKYVGISPTDYKGFG